MNKKTIFLLQKTKDECDELAAQFSVDDRFEVVGKTTDGISAISMIADKKPSVLLTELVLTGYDGLSVIDKVKEMMRSGKLRDGKTLIALQAYFLSVEK